MKHLACKWRTYTNETFTQVQHQYTSSTKEFITMELLTAFKFIHVRTQN